MINHSVRANHAARPDLHWKLSPAPVLSARTSTRLVPLEPIDQDLAIGADVDLGWFHWNHPSRTWPSTLTSTWDGSTGTIHPESSHRRRRQPGVVPLEPPIQYLAIGAGVDLGWFHWNHPSSIWPSALTSTGGTTGTTRPGPGHRRRCRPRRRHWSHKEMSRNSSVFSVVMWLEKATTSDAHLEHWKLYQSTGASHATKATTHRPGTVRADRTLALPSQLENMACATRRRCVAGLDLGAVWDVLAGIVKATTKSSLAG